MSVISFAVIKLSLITVFGFFLYRKNFITEEVLRFLTFFVITITVPFLIFSHLIGNEGVILENSLWIFIAVSLGIFLTGWILGYVFSFRRRHRLKREFISVVSFQNAGYLPMNIALFLFSPEVRERFLVYIFLYLLGFNVIMWSLGSFFIFKRKGEKFSLNSLFTPPVVATILALLLIYARLTRYIPDIIIAPLGMVGDTSFVLSMIVLGCWLGKVKLKGAKRQALLVAEASILKLMVLPLLFLLATAVFDISSLLGAFIVLQAAMPSAASLPIVANLRGADSEFVSQGVLVTHIVSVVTIPLWLSLYLFISGFSF
jgi:predicted permease